MLTPRCQSNPQKVDMFELDGFSEIIFEFGEGGGLNFTTFSSFDKVPSQSLTLFLPKFSTPYLTNTKHNKGLTFNKHNYKLRIQSIFGALLKSNMGDTHT